MGSLGRGRGVAAAGLASVLAVAAATLAVVYVALGPGSPLVATCAGAGPNHAALVVEHGDGSVVTRCVAFGSTSITGEQLLDQSGLSWSGETFGSYGRAVCALDSEPARYATCPGADGYWAVFEATGGGLWVLSPVGISTLSLADGDAEGFRYVSDSGDPVPPPSATGVCGGSAPPAAPKTPATAATTTATTSAAGASARLAGGVDPGILAAVVAGLVLAGLAGLRAATLRRRAP